MGLRVCGAAVLAVLAVAALPGCARTSTLDGSPGAERAVVTSVGGIRTAPPAASPSSRQPSRPSSRPPSRPRPAPVDHCAGRPERQLVLVSIRAQHAWLCAAGRTIYSTPVTTGMVGEYTSTPTGRYTIQDKVSDTTLTLNTGATYAVRYWIPFDAPLFGFHDSSWQDFPYGSPRYRTDGSHGCVHVPLAAIRFLYGWAEVGAAVDIRA